MIPTSSAIGPTANEGDILKTREENTLNNTTTRHYQESGSSSSFYNTLLSQYTNVLNRTITTMEDTMIIKKDKTNGANNQTNNYFDSIIDDWNRIVQSRGIERTQKSNDPETTPNNPTTEELATESPSQNFQNPFSTNSSEIGSPSTSYTNMTTPNSSVKNNDSPYIGSSVSERSNTFRVLDFDNTTPIKAHLSGQDLEPQKSDLGNTALISPLSLPLKTLAISNQTRQTKKENRNEEENNSFESPSLLSFSEGSPSRLISNSPTYLTAFCQTDFDDSSSNASEHIQYGEDLSEKDLAQKRMKSLVMQNEDLLHQLSVVLSRNEELRKALLFSESKSSSDEKEDQTGKEEKDKYESTINKLKEDLEKEKSENIRIQQLLVPALQDESKNQIQVERMKTEIKSLQETIEKMNMVVMESNKKTEDNFRKNEANLLLQHHNKQSELEKDKKKLEQENAILLMRVREYEEILKSQKYSSETQNIDFGRMWKEKMDKTNEEHLNYIQKMSKESRENEYTLKKLLEDQTIENEALKKQLENDSKDIKIEGTSFIKERMEKMSRAYQIQLETLYKTIEDLKLKNLQLNQEFEFEKLELQSLQEQLKESTKIISELEGKIIRNEMVNIALESDIKKEQLTSTHLKEDIINLTSQKESLQTVYEELFKNLQHTIREHQKSLTDLEEGKDNISKKHSILEEEYKIVKVANENLQSLLDTREKTNSLEKSNYESDITSLKQRYENEILELKSKYDDRYQSYTKKISNLKNSNEKFEKQEKLVKQVLKEKIVSSLKINDDFKSISSNFEEIQKYFNEICSEMELISVDSESLKQVMQKEIEQLNEKNLLFMQKIESLKEIVRKKDIEIEERQQAEKQLREDLHRVKITSEKQLIHLGEESESAKTELLRASRELSKEKSHLAYMEKIESSLRAEMRDLAERNHNILSQLEDQKCSNAKLVEEKNRERQKFEDDIKNYTKVVQHLNKDLEDTKKRIGSSSNSHESLSQQLKKQTEENISLNNQLLILQKERDYLKSEAKRVEEMWTNKLQDIKSHIVLIESITQKQEEKIENDKRVYQIKLQEKDSIISTLETELELRRKGTKLPVIDSSFKEELRLHNERLESKITDMEKEIEGLVCELTGCANQIQKIREEKISLESNLAQARYQLVSVQNDKESMKLSLLQRIESNEETIKALHDQLQSNLQYVHSSNESVKKTQDEQNEQNKKYNDLIVDLTRQVEEKSLDVLQLEKQNTFLVSKYESEMKRFESEFVKFSNELIKLKTHNDLLISQNKLTKQNDNSNYEEQIKSLQNSLHIAQLKIKSYEDLGNDLEKSQAESQNLRITLNKEKQKVIQLEKEKEKMKIREKEIQDECNAKVKSLEENIAGVKSFFEQVVLSHSNQ